MSTKSNRYLSWPFAAAILYFSLPSQKSHFDLEWTDILVATCVVAAFWAIMGLLLAVLFSRLSKRPSRSWVPFKDGDLVASALFLSLVGLIVVFKATAPFSMLGMFPGGAAVLMLGGRIPDGWKG